METLHTIDNANGRVGFTVPGNVLSTNAEQLRQRDLRRPEPSGDLPDGSPDG